MFLLSFYCDNKYQKRLLVRDQLELSSRSTFGEFALQTDTLIIVQTRTSLCLRTLGKCSEKPPVSLSTLTPFSGSYI